MDSLAGRQSSPSPRKGIPGGKSLAAFFGAICTLVAAIVATALAVALAASVLMIALMGGALLFLAGLSVRARRTARPQPASGPPIIEARNVGGHSWVAYGWDRRS